MDLHTRRAVLIAAVAGGTLLGGACARSGPKATGTTEQAGEKEVAPGEDLMREHGVLNRILLIYDDVGRRIDAHETVPTDVVASAAGIVRRFIEEYHEKLEEDYLFPRFEKAGRLVDLVAVLRTQHRRGRAVSDDILQRARGRVDQAARDGLHRSLQLFVRMYRPHEAREDTVLFPALHALMDEKEYESLGETFEEREHQLFGEDGFERVVDEVAQLERALGIHELSQFTPP